MYIVFYVCAPVCGWGGGEWVGVSLHQRHLPLVRRRFCVCVCVCPVPAFYPPNPPFISPTSNTRTPTNLSTPPQKPNKTQTYMLTHAPSNQSNLSSMQVEPAPGGGVLRPLVVPGQRHAGGWVGPLFCSRLSFFVWQLS